MTAAIDNKRWAMVKARKSSHSFVYAVTTTGIFSRPGCSCRLPERKNVLFFASSALAEANGFRACKRCRPGQALRQQEVSNKMGAACAAIKEALSPPSLKDLAAQAEMSVFHFQRTFRSLIGITPKEFAVAHRMERLRKELQSSDSTVTSAIYSAGFRSSSRFYEKATRALGMTPSRFKEGGAGTKVMFALGECSLGSLLVACSGKGVCSIVLGDNPEELLQDFQKCFSKADIIGGDDAYNQLIGRVIAFVDAPQGALNLPLDLRGTVFQERVWQALRAIPSGQTASYAEIALQIGAPKSYRAVARACGANPVAVAVPCHRVVRTDGGISGYRWGIERKRQLLKKEQDAKELKMRTVTSI